MRWLIVGEAYTREGLALEVDTSFPSRRVTRVLDAIAAERGLPRYLRCDNGPELTSRHFLAWAIERGVEMFYIPPGKPERPGGELQRQSPRRILEHDRILAPV